MGSGLSAPVCVHPNLMAPAEVVRAQRVSQSRGYLASDSWETSSSPHPHPHPQGSKRALQLGGMQKCWWGGGQLLRGLALKTDEPRSTLVSWVTSDKCPSLSHPGSLRLSCLPPSRGWTLNSEVPGVPATSSVKWYPPHCVAGRVNCVSRVAASAMGVSVTRSPTEGGPQGRAGPGGGPRGPALPLPPGF